VVFRSPRLYLLGKLWNPGSLPPFALSVPGFYLVRAGMHGQWSCGARTEEHGALPFVEPEDVPGYLPALPELAPESNIINCASLTEVPSREWNQPLNVEHSDEMFRNARNSSRCAFVYLALWKYTYK
jgi:hypothetical protein